eukprot:6361217-Prymnesium_polylepis.1
MLPMIAAAFSVSRDPRRVCTPSTLRSAPLYCQTADFRVACLPRVCESRAASSWHTTALGRASGLRTGRTRAAASP